MYLYIVYTIVKNKIKEGSRIYISKTFTYNKKELETNGINNCVFT